MDMPLGPYSVGIDNVSGEGSLPPGAVAGAANVDFDRNGGVSRREGYTRRMSTPSAHSLWTAQDGRSFGVVSGNLVRLVWDGATLSSTVLRALSSSLPISYDSVNRSIVCGNELEMLEIAADDTVRLLALPRPGAPSVAASTAGGLHPGRYAVALALVRGDEEGPVSMASFVDVVAGGGITVSTPTNSDATVARAYRSEANGADLYRTIDLPLGGSSLMLGASVLGRMADKQYLDALPGGQIIRHWRGQIFVARGRSVLWSEPMNYGVWDPRHNFIQFPKGITLMEPVEGGVFVGTEDGVVFLSGTAPGEMTQKKTSGMAPVAYSGMRVEAALLGGESAGDTYVAAWFAKNGIVIGTSDGQLQEVHAKRIRLPDNQAAGVGAAVIHDRRVLVTIN